MKQRSNSSEAYSAAALQATPRLLEGLLYGLFLMAFAAVWVKTVFALPWLERIPGLEGILLCLATAAVIGAISRTLPFQNVLWGAVVIGCVGGAAQTIGALVSIPFGPYVYTPAAGVRIFGVLPWTVPLMWILFIYSSRGVARLTLRPWRKTRVYGFWLMGLTATLSLVLDLGLEPFASRLQRYWIWDTTLFPYSWHGTPLTNFAGWTLTALLVMVLVTPMLINKKPGSSPAEYGSTTVWILLNILFVTAAWQHAFWLAAGFCCLATVVATVFAVRGARW